MLTHDLAGVVSDGSRWLEIAWQVQDSAQQVAEAAQQGGMSQAQGFWLLATTGGIFLLIVLAGLPLLARHRQREARANGGGADEGGGAAPPRGLGLPRGSVRSMLALLTVGGFVVVAAFGHRALGDAYERVLTTLGTLAGPVLGFYFGSRNADRNSSRDGDPK